MDQVEHEFSCPYCMAPISMVLDLSIPAQRYIEDCEVCCNPIEVAYAVDEDEGLSYFDAQSIEQ